MGKMAMTHIQTGWWYMGARGGVAGTWATEVNRYTSGVISCMGGKEEVKGGKGSQGGIRAEKEGRKSGGETT